jgi:hypothetical protein
VLYIKGILGEQLAVFIPLPTALGSHAGCDEVFVGARKFFS